MTTKAIHTRLWIVLGMLVLAPGLLYAAVTQLPDGSFKLTANNGAQFDSFGREVDISGLTAIIGSPFSDTISPNSGSAYIFTATINSISQTQQLTGNDTATDDYFGSAVAIDNTTAIVGAPNHDNGLFDNGGAAYVFINNGSTWVQQQKLLPSDPVERDAFGSFVALEGNIAIVSTADTFAKAGAVYVFERVNTTWVQRQKITPVGAAPLEGFGIGLAVAVDNTIFIGSPRDDDAGNGTGAVYVYVRNGNTWNQTQKLFPADAPISAQFGADVALDGDTAIIGAWGDDLLNQGGGFTNAGSAYIFTRSNGTWSQAQKIIASDADFGGSFGTSVDLSGNIAVVGGIGSTNESVYVFSGSGSNWSQTRQLIADDATQPINFASDVALDGGFTVVGAPADPDANTFTGAAYVYFVNDAGAYDVNNDNIITAADVIYVINRVGSNDLSADVNDDGEVTDTDVQLVLGNIGLTVP